MHEIDGMAIGCNGIGHSREPGADGGKTGNNGAWPLPHPRRSELRPSRNYGGGKKLERGFLHHREEFSRFG